MIVRITRIVVRTFLGILIFFIILLLVFDRLVQFRMDNKDLTAWFRLRHVEPHIGYFEAAGRKVRYVRTGDSSGATILFIHGAPSSMSYWRNYLTDSILLTRATMYAADRPGYGYSGLADPLPEMTEIDGFCHGWLAALLAALLAPLGERLAVSEGCSPIPGTAP